ncbi:MAG: CusA/CzcA family heavy metal efflux RND transporter [Deltaproteobacteria bacterium HGW-Deltaproteobacteria-15]|jgi:Cu(I)/Ag(I) efflux system membrane protein CusA/SilA|nr:MAG: CusA/CzcA family heavy metal efflux RND transporter [Deltaproteobacteria bacterium HGW-Deltaproteobacteria-15]
MIEKIIAYCGRNRFMVFLAVLLLMLGGVYALKGIPLDAIPDISDVQVIIYTPWEGRSPDLVEDQVTYPIVTALISAPKVKAVRGFTDFGFSFVYVIFEDGTDIYWARSRVLEYMQQFQGKLPPDVNPTIGPDATGVGWVFTYALVDESGKHDLAYLRTLQDWYIRYSLASVGGVAEVASIGGFVKQYQVNIDPNRLSSYGLSIRNVMDQIKRSNNDVEGRLLEFGGREYMVRGRGYIKSVSDIEKIAVGTNERGTPILLRDIAGVALGPEIRRGIVELDGRGEVVGGIVVMRFGENALDVINRVKEKIREIEPGLPSGVKLLPTYDRSELIELSIKSLQKTLIEEIIVVSVIIVIFLLHFRSALVPIFALPIAVIASFIPMYFLDITSNIMSLGGIALAIGVLVDSSVVMVENAYRKLSEGTEEEKADSTGTIIRASQQVGRAIFFSLIIIIISFIPVFLLEAQEGRMFRPLAFSKTFAMAASSILAITLVPVLMILFVRGKNLKPESVNPVSRFFNRIYRPFILLALRFKWTALIINFAVVPATAILIYFYPIGSEFMPPLYEGTIFYMPITSPGLSVTEAGRLLAAQDRILKGFPEVQTVFGKAGRAETSTDPAPFSMMETTVHLKPRDEWRKVKKEYPYWPELLRPLAQKVFGETRPMTFEELIAEMDQRMQFPGLQNSWTMPIRARIDMLSTGIRTPVGIKIAGADLNRIQELGTHIEMILKQVPGTRSVYAEKVAGGYFTDIVIKREEIARYGLTIGDVQDVIQTALGGMTITRTIEGRERYTVNLRYPRELRDDVEKMRRILIPISSGDAGGMQTASGAQGGRTYHVPLGQLAEISMTTGPGMIRDENGMLTGYVYLDVVGRDIGSYVTEAKQVVRDQLKLPAGYTLIWSGQYEFKLRAEERLKILLPIVFFVIFVLLYMTFHSTAEAGIVMLSVLYAMTGGVLLQKILGYNFSVAVWIGYIALYGVAVETGVVMVIYLHEALDKRLQQGAVGEKDIHEATIEGSVLRLRPKLMTVSTTLIGLLPIMWSSGVGADVMKPIAAPIIGGMITSTIHVLIITPVIFAIMKRSALKRGKLKHSGMNI